MIHNDTISARNRILAGLAAEVAFAVLPLIVVLMVLTHEGHSPKVFASPEWAFGASILFGQTLVRFVSGLVRGGAAAIGPVALAIALLVVFGLAPSLFVLFMILQDDETGRDPARWLCVAQLHFFVGVPLSICF